MKKKTKRTPRKWTAEVVMRRNRYGDALGEECYDIHHLTPSGDKGQFVTGFCAEDCEAIFDDPLLQPNETAVVAITVEVVPCRTRKKKP